VSQEREAGTPERKLRTASLGPKKGLEPIATTREEREERGRLCSRREKKRGGSGETHSRVLLDKDRIFGELRRDDRGYLKERNEGIVGENKTRRSAPHGDARRSETRGKGRETSR